MPYRGPEWIADAITHIPEAELPDSGAWTEVEPYKLPAGVKRVGFFVEYAGGAAGGAVRYRIRKGFSGDALAVEQVLDGTIVPSGADGAQTSYDAIYERPTTGTAETSFLVDVDVEGGWTHVVLDLAENGDTDNPGTATAIVGGSY